MPDAPGELEPEGSASYDPGTPGGLTPEGGGAASPGDPGNLTPSTPAAPEAPPSITPETPPSVPAGAQWATQDQAEAGASSITLMSPLRTRQAIKAREVHVLAEDYGATGDGVTDDRASLQAAINAVGALGGGTISLRADSIYRVTENGATGYCLLMPYNSVRLIGQGISTRIACADATATTILVAKAVGPYDADTEWVDHCEIRDLYFNPLIQKDNDSVEIRVPYSRHFVCENVHFGRYQGLVSFIDGEIPADEESKIGTFMFVGTVEAPFSSTMTFRDIRGFGYYRAIRATKIAGLVIDSWGSDANREDAQSIQLVGAVEAALFSNFDFVNSAGVNGSDDACLLIESVFSSVPRFCKFTNGCFDSHKWAVKATAGYSMDFVGCWTSGKNSPGVLLDGTADQFRFTSGQGMDNTQEGFSILAGNHLIANTEVTGVAKTIADTASKAAIYIGPSSGLVTLDNVRVTNSSGSGIDPSNALASLHIAAGPKRVSVIGGQYNDGIYDLSGLEGSVSLTSMDYWLRPSGSVDEIDGRLSTRWANSLLSKFIGRSPGDAFRPAFRSNVGGVPCFEFNKGGRNSNCFRLYDEIAGVESSVTLGDFTITAMVKVTGDAAILGRSNNNWNLRISSAGIMSIRFAGAATTVSADTPLTTAMGEWVLLTWRRTGDTIEFFENGVLLDTQTGASTEGVVYDQIGGFNGQEFPVGYIAEFVIRTVAESDPSLAALSLAIMNSHPTVFSV